MPVPIPRPGPRPLPSAAAASTSLLHGRLCLLSPQSRSSVLRPRRSARPPILRSPRRRLHDYASVGASATATAPANKHPPLPNQWRLLATQTSAPSTSASSSTPSSTSASTATASSSGNHDAPHQASTSSSVDPSQLRHFSSLAASWWDPYGPSRLLHLMNPLRHEFISQCTRTLTSSGPALLSGGAERAGLCYLDVGCGGGIFAESAARLPTTASVTALDPSPEVIIVAKEHARRDPSLSAERLRYLNVAIESFSAGTAGQAPPDNAGFDVVTSFEVIEHVSQPSDFLAQLASHVRPGGWLVLSTIARTWVSWAVHCVTAEQVLGMVPRGTHEWSKFINLAELQAWFDKGPENGQWEAPRAMGVVYVPGLGWREVSGGEEWGNYFFAIRKKME